MDIEYGTTIFGLLTVGGLLAAIAGYAIASVPRPRRPATVPAGPRLGYGIAAGVFAAICLLVVPVPKPPEVAEGPLAEAAADARANRADSPEALRSWLDNEGLRLFNAVLGPLRRAMVEGGGDPDAGIAPDLKAARAELAEVARTVEEVRTEPGPPGRKAHRLWSDWLSSVDTAARLIARGMETGDKALLNEGLAEYGRSTKLIESLAAISE